MRKHKEFKQEKNSFKGSPVDGEILDEHCL